jgi:hypothetical protein
MSVDEAVELAGKAKLTPEGDYVGGNTTLVEVPNEGNVLENVNGGESDCASRWS